jgi:hypothetical protein
MTLSFRRLFGSFAAVAVVAALAAVGLRGLDAVPEVLASSTRQHRLSSLAELDRDWQRRLAVPAYFPSAVAWPPSSVRTVGRPARTVLLGFTAPDGGPERLLLVQSDQTPVPSELLPGGVVLARASVPLGGTEAELTRRLGEDGLVWHQLAWTRGDQSLVLRSRGSEEQLVRMAASVRSP